MTEAVSRARPPAEGRGTDTRTRLIHAALELFWFTGYERTSLAEICGKAGANPGSLYHFFPSKQAILEAVLQRLRDTIHEGLIAPAWSGVDDPIERVFALLGAYRRSLEMTDLKYGCPIGSLSLEWRDPPESVRHGLAANFEAWTAVVRECLEEARDRFPSSIDLDGLATFVLTTMEGAVMQARTFRSLERFDRSVDALRDYFDRLQHRPAR